MSAHSSATSLTAHAVANDPLIQAAKNQILQAMQQHCKTITQIRSPLTHLEKNYQETVQQFGQLRGIPLWHPYIGSGMGNGALVELCDGSVKYDFISGIGVHWGHCHPLLMQVALDAACENTIMQGNLQQNQEAFELTKILIDTSGLDHCLLTTSGAMAMENALKLLFQKKHPAHRILAFEKCFAGRTLTLSQISDKAAFREGLPTTIHVDYVPFYDWRDPIGSTEKAAQQLKKYLLRYPGQYAAMCFEMVQGEGGYYPGSHEFFMTLIHLLQEKEIPVLVDEVQTFGRTDHLFAFQHFGLQKHVDVVTVGKLLQACATLYRSSCTPKMGLISQTFTASTSSIKAGLAIIKSLLTDGYLNSSGKNMSLRKRFVDHLQILSTKYPEYLEGPFGCGLMIAFTPFKGEQKKVQIFIQELFKAGVIAFLAGSNPTRIRFLVPAGSVTNKDIDAVAAIIEETLKRQST